MSYTVKTPTSDAAWRPDHFEFAPTDVVDDALIIQTSTKAGEIEGDAPSVRVAFVDDSTAENIHEADTFAESEPALSEALIFSTKIGQLIRVSREQFLQPNTSQQLAQSVARSIVRKADKNYLTQSPPVSPDVAPVAGLLHWPGTVDGGLISENLDGLIDLIAELEANQATPSAILLGPRGWAEARKWKTALDHNSTLLGSGTVDAKPMMLSLPVIVCKAITDMSGLVVDKRAIVSAYGTVTVRTSMDRYFDSDSVGLISHWRTGHTVPRPERLGKFTLTPGGS